MNTLVLELPNRESLEVSFNKNPDRSAETFSSMDGLVIETNWGFNDLGIYGKYIAQAMDIDEYIFRFYGEPLLKESLPTIDIVPSLSHSPTLKAVALISTPNCEAYKPFMGGSGRPNKDFFYNITYEALCELAQIGCTHIGIAGLTGSLLYVDDSQYKNVVAEAVCHIAHDFPHLRRIQILSNGPDISHGIGYFNEFKEECRLHRKISIEKKDWYGLKRITLDIPRRF